MYTYGIRCLKIQSKECLDHIHQKYVSQSHPRVSLSSYALLRALIRCTRLLGEGTILKWHINDLSGHDNSSYKKSGTNT